MKIHVFVDFDGTIMSCDTTDHLFELFALPAWHEVEEEWAAGQIGSRECMARQVDLLRVSREQLLSAVDRLEIDPGFAGFLAACAARGVGVTVVSDGLDVVIERVLARHRLNVPFFANRLVEVGQSRWRLEFPNARPSCAAGAGHCKCAHTMALNDHLSVIVGDGRSDFCIAGRADLVIAKSKLLEECGKVGIPHLPFRDFNEVTELLMGWHAAGSDRHRSRVLAPLEA